MFLFKVNIYFDIHILHLSCIYCGLGWVTTARNCMSIKNKKWVTKATNQQILGNDEKVKVQCSGLAF